MNRDVCYVTVVPTDGINDEGYFTGKVTCYNKEDEELGHWKSDSLQLLCRTQCDFQVDHGVKIWSLSGKPLRVERGDTTRIYEKVENEES